jgi:hypothetical protein
MFAAAAFLTTPAPASTKLTLSDNFTRADNPTDLGASWTNRNGALGISGNKCVPITNHVYVEATHNTPLTQDDMSVSFTFGPLSGSDVDYGWVILGADTGGTNYAWAGIFAGTPYLLSVTNWSFTAGFTIRSSGGATFTTGDVFTLSRIGNVYTGFKNGSPSGLAWTDSSNVITRGSSNRLVGIGGLNSDASYRSLASWSATEL